MLLGLFAYTPLVWHSELSIVILIFRLTQRGRIQHRGHQNLYCHKEQLAMAAPRPVSGALDVRGDAADVFLGNGGDLGPMPASDGAVEKSGDAMSRSVTCSGSPKSLA
jgi:hypothetical protein